MIGKFGYWQELDLFVLLIIDNCLEVRLYNTILFFVQLLI